METLVFRSIWAECHPREVAPPTLSRTVRDDEVPKVREITIQDVLGMVAVLGLWVQDTAW